MRNNLKKQVLKKLEQVDDLSGFDVTLLPDFFLDHVLRFKDFDGAIEEFSRIYHQGGGNFPIENQMLISGGNAANTALALAKLGVKAHLIAKTSELGTTFIKKFLEKNGVDTSRVKTDGELSTTVALEFEGRNVMLSYAGSLSNFSFDELDEEDLDLIASSDVVCVTNWVLNKRGTELAEKVFSLAKENDVRTFFDMGDPFSRKEDLPELVKKVLSSRVLDVLSLNENELKWVSNSIGIKQQNIQKILEELQNTIYPRIDVHTKDFSISNGIEISCFRVEKRISTGAGDAWNAGNILGDLLGFKDDERLLLANATAACYISDPPNHPTLEKLRELLTKK